MKAKTKSKKLKGALQGTTVDGSVNAPGMISWSPSATPAASASPAASVAPVAAPAVMPAVSTPPVITSSQTQSQATRNGGLFPFGAAPRQGEMPQANGTQGAPSYGAPNWLNQLSAIYGHMYGGSGANIRAGLNGML